MENGFAKNNNKTGTEHEVRKKNSLIEWIKFVLFLTFLVLLIHNSIGLTTISGFSMNPSFQDGDFVLEEKVSRFFTTPKVGDVVVINRPVQGYKIVKRILGLPGDTVEIKAGLIYLNQLPIPEISIEGTPPDMPVTKVPKNHIFVVGDNRTPGESIDSRDPNVGPIEINEIDGYVIFSLIPFKSIPKPISLN